MRSFEWMDIVRVVVVVGLAMGAWLAFKRMPPSIRFQGRRYCRGEDGNLQTLWGRRMTEPAAVAEIERLWAQRPQIKS